MIDMSVDEQVTSSEHTNKQAQQLLTLVQYMPPAEVEQVAQALRLAQDTCGGMRGERPLPPLEHALAVATILAEIMHIDAVGVAAGLVFEAVDSDLLPLERLETTLGVPVARVVGSMLRMNILERKKRVGASVSSHPSAGESENNREQKKQRVREALRRQQAETVRKMFFAMSEDPRVVMLKLAYRLHAMRMISARTSSIARFMRPWPVGWVCRLWRVSWRTWHLQPWSRKNTRGCAARWKQRAGSGAPTWTASVRSWVRRWQSSA